MTDLEITKLCAEAMGYNTEVAGEWLLMWAEDGRPFSPLTDDAQAMALVKKFGLLIVQDDSGAWDVTKMHLCSDGIPPPYKATYKTAFSIDLNHAICECVAKMQAAK